MSSVTKTISNVLRAETCRRRFVVQLGLGSAVLLLSACGGGGGSGLAEDDSSATDNTARLRRAFDELQPGMTTEDVINFIGIQPTAETPASLTWEAPGGFMIVTFNGGTRNGMRVINGASWGSASESLSRGFL